MKICKSCGYVGEDIDRKRGDSGTELLLWLFFIFPGFLYSLWRRGGQRRACPKCGHDEMVPLDSPIGKKIVEENHISLPVNGETGRKTGLSLIQIILIVIGAIIIFAAINGSK